MPRLVRMLPKPYFALLVALAILWVGNPPARGDVGRNGGIVILPCATHVTQWGKAARASYLFVDGVDVSFQFSTLNNVILVASSGPGGPSVPGSISGSIVTFRAAQLRELRSVGVTELRVQLIDADMMGYDLWISLGEEEEVSVELR